MRLLTLLTMPILLGPSIPIDPKPILFFFKDDFDYIEIPVLVPNEPSTVYFRYSYEAKTTYYRAITIYIPKYGNTGSWETIFHEDFETRSIERTFTFTHNLPAAAGTVHMRFVAEEMGNDLTDMTFDIPLRQLGSVNIDQNSQCSINRNAIIHSLINGTSTATEKYEFNNFFTSYSPMNSYLDISQLYLTYRGPKTSYNKVRDLIYKEVTFLIDDYDNLFDDIGTYDPPHTHSLKLNLVKDNIGYHLQWKQKMYVDPLTLRMSNTLKDGYVETPYFYFPRGVDYAQTIKCILFFRYLGLNQENFAIRFNIDKSTPVIGYCGVGSYCVTSTSGTPNFEIGESVTYS